LFAVQRNVIVVNSGGAKAGDLALQSNVAEV
jgi:hypothetical protein